MIDSIRQRARISSMKTLICLVTVWLVCSTARADVRLPKLITDNMVLQRDRPIRIWGWADAGEGVTITLAGKTVTATTGTDGRWLATLPAMPAGVPHMLTVRGRNELTVTNVLVGEVWLCSGQSNMEFGLTRARGGVEAMQTATNRLLRLFHVDNRASFELLDDVQTRPVDDPKGGWYTDGPASASNFPAVAYFFGRELVQDLNVPVGLIKAAWGGTAIELWIPRDDLRTEPSVAALFGRETAVRAVTNAPPGTAIYRREQLLPSIIFNGIVAPLTNYVIRGALWYQGENNAGPDYAGAYPYRRLLPLLIQSWRRAWNCGEFPFLVVQLPNMGRKIPVAMDPTSTFAVVREGQSLAQSVSNVFTAVTIDTGDGQVHSPLKQMVAHRLTRLALAHAYGHQIEADSPTLCRMTVVGDKVRLAFEHVGGGLVVSNAPAARGFAVAGANRMFHEAAATVEGEELVLASPAVPQPVAVRYLWANNPDVTLYNRAGLPVAPFRTDDWPDNQ